MGVFILCVLYILKQYEFRQNRKLEFEELESQVQQIIEFRDQFLVNEMTGKPVEADGDEVEKECEVETEEEAETQEKGNDENDNEENNVQSDIILEDQTEAPEPDSSKITGINLNKSSKTENYRNSIDREAERALDEVIEEIEAIKEEENDESKIEHSL